MKKIISVLLLSIFSLGFVLTNPITVYADNVVSTSIEFESLKNDFVKSYFFDNYIFNNIASDFGNFETGYSVTAGTIANSWTAHSFWTSLRSECFYLSTSASQVATGTYAQAFRLKTDTIGTVGLYNDNINFKQGHKYYIGYNIGQYDFEGTDLFNNLKVTVYDNGTFYNYNDIYSVSGLNAPFNQTVYHSFDWVADRNNARLMLGVQDSTKDVDEQAFYLDNLQIYDLTEIGLEAMNASSITNFINSYKSEFNIDYLTKMGESLFDIDYSSEILNLNVNSNGFENVDLSRSIINNLYNNIDFELELFSDCVSLFNITNSYIRCVNENTTVELQISLSDYVVSNGSYYLTLSDFEKDTIKRYIFDNNINTHLQFYFAFGQSVSSDLVNTGYAFNFTFKNELYLKSMFLNTNADNSSSPKKSNFKVYDTLDNVVNTLYGVDNISAIGGINNSYYLNFNNNVLHTNKIRFEHLYNISYSGGTYSYMQVNEIGLFATDVYSKPVVINNYDNYDFFEKPTYIDVSGFDILGYLKNFLTWFLIDFPPTAIIYNFFNSLFSMFNALITSILSLFGVTYSGGEFVMAYSGILGTLFSALVIIVLWKLISLIGGLF